MIRVSSSISNFKDGLYRRFQGHSGNRTIFFGMYHLGDLVRFVFARGPKAIFWCGADIAHLPRWWVPLLGDVHYCENMTEQAALYNKGIYAATQPMLFDNPDKYQITFTPSQTPHVFTSIRPGREVEYGLPIIQRIAPRLPEITFHIYGIEGESSGNLCYHGFVHPDQFDHEIKNYHSALRLNEFDGFAETTAKSILHGQYPITRIFYPRIWSHLGDEEILIELLSSLKYMSAPNTEARDYWYKELSKPL